MKKKILIFSLAYYPKHIGGAEVAIKEITDRIPTDAYEFHLVCNRYDSTLPQKEQIGNVFVHRIGVSTKNPSMGNLRKFPLHFNKFIYQWYAFWYAKKLHKKEKFDGIWAMMAHACGVPAGKFKKSFPEMPYLLTLQEGDPLPYIEHKMRWFGKAFDEAFTQADMVQAISTFLAGWAKQKGFTGKTVYIPNAVNIAHFTAPVAPNELEAARESLGKKGGDIFLVTTSRLVKKNAVDDVIRALPLLPPQVHFIVFGIGPDEEALKELAATLGVSNRVQFRGHIGHNEMPTYLKACDIFIRPSRSEGMGNSFVEAMAAELPVIATQEGGIADFLFDAKKNPDKPTTGWAVRPDNPEDIAVAVKAIMANPDRVATVRAIAKAMAMKDYDWDFIAQRMKIEVFDELF